MNTPMTSTPERTEQVSPTLRIDYYDQGTIAIAHWSLTDRDTIDAWIAYSARMIHGLPSSGLLYVGLDLLDVTFREDVYFEQRWRELIALNQGIRVTSAVVVRAQLNAAEMEIAKRLFKIADQQKQRLNLCATLDEALKWLRAARDRGQSSAAMHAIQPNSDQ